MRNAYCPGVSFDEGNRYRPCSSLTTVMVIVEPAFLAPTRTPSIGPSSAELTTPERATEGDVSARPGADWKQTPTKIMASTRKRARTFIGPPSTRDQTQN